MCIQKWSGSLVGFILKRQSWKLQPAELHIPLAFVPHFTQNSGKRRFA
jgi:hypothetical protein